MFPKLPSLQDLARLLEAAADRIVLEIRALKVALVKGHRENADAVENFLAFGTVSVAPATRELVLTIAATTHKRGYVKGLANVIDEGNRWADTALAGGMYFQVAVGGQVRPGLAAMNSPWGFIGARGRITIPFDSAKKVEIYAVNAHATETLTACVQASGYVEEGLAQGLEGIGPQIAGRRVA